MGFFSYAYVIEGQQVDGGVDFTISAYAMDETAFFTWGRGVRPEGMESIAGGTLFCAQPMSLLPGYPRVDARRASDFAEGRFLYVEESFFARREDEPVLFHVVLPKRFIIRRDRTPFTLTKAANITVLGDRLVFTLPAVGSADLRFWIAPLLAGEEFENYELDKFLSAPEAHSPKVGFEVNLGVFKIKIG